MVQNITDLCALSSRPRIMNKAVALENAKSGEYEADYNWRMLRWRRFVLRQRMWRERSQQATWIKMLRTPEQRQARIQKAIQELKPTKPRRKVQHPALPQSLSKLKKDALQELITRCGIQAEPGWSIEQMKDILYAVPSDIKIITSEMARTSGPGRVTVCIQSTQYQFTQKVDKPDCQKATVIVKRRIETVLGEDGEDVTMLHAEKEEERA